MKNNVVGIISGLKVNVFLVFDNFKIRLNIEYVLKLLPYDASYIFMICVLCFFKWISE
jgi:hypothetical protein